MGCAPFIWPFHFWPHRLTISIRSEIDANRAGQHNFTHILIFVFRVKNKDSKKKSCPNYFNEIKSFLVSKYIKKSRFKYLIPSVHSSLNRIFITFNDCLLNWYKSQRNFDFNESIYHSCWFFAYKNNTICDRPIFTIKKNANLSSHLTFELWIASNNGEEKKREYVSILLHDFDIIKWKTKVLLMEIIGKKITKTKINQMWKLLIEQTI